MQPLSSVTLLVNNSQVGVAVLHKTPGALGPNEDCLCRSLHGTALKGSYGQDFVVAKTIVVYKPQRSLPYPYKCPGPEESPVSLKNVFNAGLYVWGSNQLR